MKISNPRGLNNSPLITLDMLKKQLDALSATITNAYTDILTDKDAIPLSEYGYAPLNEYHKIDSQYYDSVQINKYEFSTSSMTASPGYTDDFSGNSYITLEKEIPGFVLKIEDVYTETKTPKQIIEKSINYLYTTTATMLYSLWQLITGKVSASDMHGVIAVVKVGGDIIASKGMLNGILLTAMISINLAIMNFLPIPALDGGHVMFLLIEKFTGKKPDREFSEKINNFFFILLIILMISICYNDIFALITKKL